MIYLFLADGFEEIEALATIDILRRAKLNIITVGIGGKTIESARGVKVLADISENEVKKEGLEMVILPGGAGADVLDKSPTVHNIINYANQSGIYIAAICAAPAIPGKTGVMSGKKAVCYPGYEQELRGAIIQKNENVVSDGKFITAKGAGSTLKFALKLVEILSGLEVSDKIRNSIFYEC